MSDVPLGAMLSGGLDSSLIVALMARHMTEPVKTFSVGFVEDGDGQRAADARLVAELSGPSTTSSSSRSPTDVDLEDLVWHLDEPLADLSRSGSSRSRSSPRSTSQSPCRARARTSSSADYRKHRAAALAGRSARALRPSAPCGARPRRAPGRVRRAAGLSRRKIRRRACSR